MLPTDNLTEQMSPSVMDVYPYAKQKQRFDSY